jgi:hypothetical protein
MDNMNGFERHGIKHSSPSSINMWVSAPCAWVARYLFNAKFAFGNPARAGVLVEEAVIKVLAGGYGAQAAIDEAVAQFNKAIALGGSNADMKRRDAMRGMIENALKELAPFGDPDFEPDLIHKQKQRKAEMLCNGDGWELPVIGYMDLVYDKLGIVVDLKTTMAAPTNMSDEHKRQGAFYRGAMGNYGVKFLYVTGSKAVWHEIQDYTDTLKEFKAILNRQERFLASGDAATLKDIVPVAASSFYWGGDEALRKELYGI